MAVFTEVAAMPLGNNPRTSRCIPWLITMAYTGPKPTMPTCLGYHRLTHAGYYPEVMHSNLLGHLIAEQRHLMALLMLLLRQYLLLLRLIDPCLSLLILATSRLY